MIIDGQYFKDGKEYLKWVEKQHKLYEEIIKKRGEREEKCEK